MKWENRSVSGRSSPALGVTPMKMRRLLVATISFAIGLWLAQTLGLFAKAAHADEPAAVDFERMNADLIETVLLPGYARLETATTGLAQTANAFCSAPDQAGFEAVAKEFNAVADAWASIDVFRFGPIGLLFRHERFNFWPDQRNSAAKALAGLLEEETLEADNPSQFINRSAAGQGLPALERLLFAESYGQAFFLSPPDGVRPCPTLQAIVGNLEAIAAQSADGWVEGDPPYREFFAKPGEENPFYQTHKEGTLAFVKTGVEGLTVIADQRLGRPLGESLEKARERRAEQWWSGRSLNNILWSSRMLKSVLAPDDNGGIAGLLKAAGEEALAEVFRADVALLVGKAEALDGPLGKMLSDPASWGELDALRAQALAVRARLVEEVAPALGMNIGFNRFDGD